jgi:hypothetical protein
VILSQNANVQPPNATALPHGINPIDNSDSDLTPPPETPPPEIPPPETPPPEIPPPQLRRSGSTAGNVNIAMVIEHRPKTYRAGLDAEDAAQWKEPMGKEMTSMECHEVFTFVETVPEGASMSGSHWVIGRKLMANGTIHKWKV